MVLQRPNKETNVGANMLRLSIYYEGASLGRNDGNPLYVNSFLKRTQWYCDKIQGNGENGKILRYFPDPKNPYDPLAEEVAHYCIDKFGGVEIEHLRPDGDLKPWGTFDYHLWIDWGEDGLTGILPYTPKVPEKNLVYWASDTHLGYDYRAAMCKKAKIAFCAQKDAAISTNSIWLPHAVEPLAYNKSNMISKKYDVCFVGHVNASNRIDMLDRAFKEFPDFWYGQRRFNDASEKYRQGRVCLNQAMKDDVNMRCFEIMASGSLLLTDKVQSIEELFTDKKHCVYYNDLDDMVEKAKHYIWNVDERKAIEEAGYKEVMEKHTFKNRIMVMLEEISKQSGGANEKSIDSDCVGARVGVNG